MYTLMFASIITLAVAKVSGVLWMGILLTLLMFLAAWRMKPTANHRVAHYANRLNILITDAGWKELPGILAGTSQKFNSKESLYADVALCFAFTTIAVELKECMTNKRDIEHILQHCLHVQTQIYDFVQNGVISPANGIACASLVSALVEGDEPIINRLIGPFNQNNKMSTLMQLPTPQE